MRVLITTTAGLGHINPMVPLAGALAGRGHDLLWAAPADGIGHVERAGFPTVQAGGPGITDPAGARRRYPEVNALPPHQVPEVMFGKLFGAMAAPAMLAELLPAAREWRPDLVVADAAALAAHLVAAELGVPSVSKGFGPILPERRYKAAESELAPLWRGRGLEPRPYGGSFDHLYLDIYPPALPAEDRNHIPRLQPLRPVAHDGALDPGADVPLPDGPPGWPLVYVTMGTVFSGPAPLAPVLAALGDLRARALVTVGPSGDPAALGPQPPHVRVERYVPQTTLLPHCDVVVSHGGSGTVLATLALGLPQLCLPQGADQFLNARAVAAVGAGVELRGPEGTAEAVAAAVAALVEDGSYRRAAGRVAESIAAMPAPEAVAADLEAIATTAGSAGPCP